MGTVHPIRPAQRDTGTTEPVYFNKPGGFSYRHSTRQSPERARLHALSTAIHAAVCSTACALSDEEIARMTQEMEIMLKTLQRRMRPLHE